jgi:hypothetical protein
MKPHKPLAQMSLTERRAYMRSRIKMYRKDWCLFAKEVLGVTLDPEQEAILRSVQFNARTSVASGTARGKDFISAVACMCFMYLTPRWTKGQLTHNTKVAMTAPTGRQVKNIMMPEISRLWNRARRNGMDAPGRLNMSGIRTEYDEWFLTGFKADEHQHEAWSGFHAVNTMFVVTEASGMSEMVFNAIEGNLQGNSRIIIVFNPNSPTGYAAKSQKSPHWNKFRLNSLNAPNVLYKKELIPGQVDYAWVKNKVEIWSTPIAETEVAVEKHDFEFEGQWYRPNDLFRVKVLGVFPEVPTTVLIPQEWVEAANARWKDIFQNPDKPFNGLFHDSLRLGSDVAGMGRDNSVECYRYGNTVHRFETQNSGGKADHMGTAGRIKHQLDRDTRTVAIIDTIGEGAGVYSRLIEQGYENRVFSCKYSEAAKNTSGDYLHDSTGQYIFANKRAYLHWMVREWLDPKNKHHPALPPDDLFLEEACEAHWSFDSSGRVVIEAKDDIVKRLGRSPDKFDSLANTFDNVDISNAMTENLELLNNLL